MSEEEAEPEDISFAPHLQPGILATKSQVKRAHKKREKLARRAARAGGSDGAAPGNAPLGRPTAMVVETSLHYGSFERHTTGVPKIPPDTLPEVCRFHVLLDILLTCCSQPA